MRSRAPSTPSVELALGDIHEARVESAGVDDSSAVRPDYTASPNDNVIIDGISGNDSSLGWVGFAFADENSDRVKLLGVDGGAGCVEPTPETIASGDFPLSRFLYTYVDAAKAESDPALAAFVDYLLSDEGLAHVTEADYVASTPPTSSSPVTTGRAGPPGSPSADEEAVPDRAAQPPPPRAASPLTAARRRAATALDWRCR